MIQKLNKYRHNLWELIYVLKKFYKRYLYLITSILLSIPGIIINFKQFSTPKTQITEINILISVISILLWLLFGVFAGWKVRKDFLLFLSKYWSFGIGIYLLTYYLNCLVLTAPAIILILCPIYAISELMPIRKDALGTIVILLSPWLMGIIGYLLGKISSCYLNTVKKSKCNI
jgi:hypothetical protein